MITIRLKGGLGNQMFQYALGRALALKNDTELKIDTSFFYVDFKSITKRTYNLDVFNIKAEIAKESDIPFIFRLPKSRIAIYLIFLFRKIIKSAGQEKSFNFDKSILSIGRNAYLDGYWQSPKYFEGFEDIIRKDFTLKKELLDNVIILKEQIEKNNSLCVHLRRGDYVGNANHEVVNNDYYTKSIALISQNTDIEKIYVFSDDINWCKENIKFEFPTMYVGEEYAGTNAEGHLALMTTCKHFIICNSSFSWWAAWLSDNPDKIVVAPKQWFKDEGINSDDLIPNGWIRI